MPELRVPTTVLRQYNTSLYMFTLPSNILRRICYVLPRSKDNPKEIQRVLTKKKMEEIGTWLKKPTALLPNNIIVNLEPAVQFVPGVTPDKGVLVFPSDGSEDVFPSPGATKYAYVLDGQHRLAGFDYAGGIVFDLPVVGFLQLPTHSAADVFATINSTQTKASPIHLEEVLREIGALKDERSRAVDIVAKLNEDADSPWQGKIRTTTQKGLVSAVTLGKYIIPLISDDGPLADKTLAEQTAILKNYFIALRELFPVAWGNNKYVLTKAIGAYLALMLFRRISDRREKYEGDDTSPSSFKAQMEPLRRITWSSGTYGKFSNAKAMNALWKALLRVLPLEAGQEPSYEGLEELGIIL